MEDSALCAEIVWTAFIDHPVYFLFVLFAILFEPKHEQGNHAEWNSRHYFARVLEMRKPPSTFVRVTDSQSPAAARDRETVIELPD